jgi:hypothetical protein
VALSDCTRFQHFSAQNVDRSLRHDARRILRAVDGRTITVRMRANRRDTGMRFNHQGLEWTLRPQSVDDFAELVDVLAASGKSGHQYLACGVTDEITVMVSHDEYPEDLRL